MDSYWLTESPERILSMGMTWFDWCVQKLPSDLLLFPASLKSSHPISFYVWIVCESHLMAKLLPTAPHQHVQEQSKKRVSISMLPFPGPSESPRIISGWVSLPSRNISLRTGDMKLHLSLNYMPNLELVSPTPTTWIDCGEGGFRNRNVGE